MPHVDPNTPTSAGFGVGSRMRMALRHRRRPRRAVPTSEWQRHSCGRTSADGGQLGVAGPVRTFHTSSRRPCGPLRAARGTPRLAASLPARRPRLRATASGHDEARHRRGSAITGLPVNASRTTAASCPAASTSRATTAPHGSGATSRGRQRTAPAGRCRAGSWPQGRCLRRAGPPALRPGDGLRRPGLLAPDPRRLWDASAATGDPSPTRGHQTAPTWSRSYVQWGAPPGPGRRGPAGRSLRDGMPDLALSGPSGTSDPYRTPGFLRDSSSRRWPVESTASD